MPPALDPCMGVTPGDQPREGEKRLVLVGADAGD